MTKYYDFAFKFKTTASKRLAMQLCNCNTLTVTDL